MERDSILIEKEMQRYVQRMWKINENTWKKRIKITYKYLQKKKIVTKAVQGYSHKLGGIGAWIFIRQ